MAAGAGRWLAHVPRPISSQAKLASACFRVTARPLTAAPWALWGLSTTPRLSGRLAEPPAFPPPLSHGDFGLIPSAQDTTEPLPLCLTTWASRHRPREPSGKRLACFLRCVHFIINPIPPVSCLSLAPGLAKRRCPESAHCSREWPLGFTPRRSIQAVKGPVTLGGVWRKPRVPRRSLPGCAPGPLPSPGSVSWKERQRLLGKGL